jgi:hypothetical protein
LARNRDNVSEWGDKACWSSTKQTSSSSSHWKLTFSRHDIVEKLLSRHWITITHSSIYKCTSVSIVVVISWWLDLQQGLELSINNNISNMCLHWKQLNSRSLLFINTIKLALSTFRALSI